MEVKDLIGLALLLAAALAGTTLCVFSPRARDAAFFLLTAGLVVAHKLDINFLSQEWYRGTTRGLEYSFVDVLALAVLGGAILAPPRDGLNQGAIYWPAGLGLMLLFLVYASFTVVIHEPRLFGVFELSKMLRGIVVFLAAAFYVRGRREVTILVLALCCAMAFEGLLGMRQRFLQGVYRVTGSLEHENSFSMYLCLVGPLLVAAAHSDLPRWLRAFGLVGAGLATISIVLTISRAGIPIFAMVMLGTTLFCMTWRISWGKVVGVGVMTLGVGALLYGAWDSLALRYGQASFEEEYLDRNVEGRGHYLRLGRMVAEDRLFGVGLNNWSYWISKTYGARLGMQLRDYDELRGLRDLGNVDTGFFAPPAHNLAALVAGELGFPGLALFGLLWWRWFHLAFRFLWRRTSEVTHRLGVGLFFGLCGIFLQSVTEWTFRQTHLYLTFHLLVGVLASLCWLRRHEKAAAGIAGPFVASTELEAEHELHPAVAV